jgi:hypothetical protein
MDNDEMKVKIEEFYKKEFFNVESSIINETIFEISYFVKKDLYPTTKMKLYVNFAKKCVAKFNANTKHEPLLCKELRLFDNFGFDLCSQAKEETNQDVNDWFYRKCNDEYIEEKNSEIIENRKSFTKNQNDMNQNLQQDNNELTLYMYIDPVSQEKVDFVKWINELLNKKDIDLRDLNGVISSDVKYNMFNRKHYNLTKEIAISLVIGLELNLDEAQELMHKAGFHLSEYIEYDRIILSAIENEFGIFETNLELLKIKSKKMPESKDIRDRYQYSNKLLGPKAAQDEAWKKLNNR